MAKLNMKKLALVGGGAVVAVYVLNRVAKAAMPDPTEATKAEVEAKAKAGAGSNELVQTILKDPKVQEYVDKINAGAGKLEDKAKTVVSGLLSKLGIG